MSTRLSVGYLAKNQGNEIIFLKTKHLRLSVQFNVILLNAKFNLLFN